MSHLLIILLIGVLLRFLIRGPNWGPEVRQFKTGGFIQDSILFTGSSSIRLWETLSKDMAPLPVLNRGFGGSRMSDLPRYSDEIFSGCNPKAVVIYSGENDFALNPFKRPVAVLKDFQRFVYLIQSRFPGKPIYVISIKFSPSRKRKWKKFDQTNLLLQQFAQECKGVTFIDTNTALSGYSSSQLYSPDMLHFSPGGYAVWTSVIKPILLQSSAA